jgi:pantothenate kinase
VRPLLDEAWFVDVAPSERRRRLVLRRMSHGHAADESEAWVTTVDEPNALIAERTRPLADLVVTPASLLG